MCDEKTTTIKSYTQYKLCVFVLKEYWVYTCKFGGLLSNFVALNFTV